MGGTCSTDGAGRDAYRVLVGRPDRQRPLGKPRLDGSVILKRIFKK